MIWKKTWFSYAVWILFGAISVSLFLTGAGKFCAGLGFAGPLQSIIIPLFLGAVFTCGLAALKKYLGGRTEKSAESEKKALHFAWEGLAVILLVTVGIFIRMYFVPAEGSNFYFEAAKVAKGNVLQPSAHGIAYLYTGLLRIVFLLFGNKWIAGIVLQCILQFTAGILLYCGVRKAAGKVPSLCMLAAIMIFPASVKIGLSYGPEMLFLCLYALALQAVFGFLRSRRMELRMHGALKLTGLFFLGLCLGAFTGVQLWTATLFPLVLSAAWIRKEKESARTAKAGVQLPVILGGSIAGFVVYLAGYGAAAGRTIGEAFGEWLGIYENAGFVGMQMLRSMTAYGGYLFLGMLFIVILFAFTVRKEADVLNGWLLVFLTVTGLVLFQVSASLQIGYSMLIWLVPVMIGTGVVELLKPRQAALLEITKEEPAEAAYEKALEETELMKVKKSKKLNEEQRPAYNTALMQDANEHMEKPKPVYSHPLMEDDEGRSGSYINVTSQPVPIRSQQPEKAKVISEESILQAAIEEPLLFQPIGEPILEQPEEGSVPLPVPMPFSVPDAGVLQADTAAESQNVKPEPEVKTEAATEAKPVHFIENPLPVPKKHVPKTMDYDLEPEESKMFFDVWVTNNDDFDIKD